MTNNKNVYPVVTGDLSDVVMSDRTQSRKLYRAREAVARRLANHLLGHVSEESLQAVAKAEDRLLVAKQEHSSILHAAVDEILNKLRC
jgi:hypothetical protein